MTDRVSPRVKIERIKKIKSKKKKVEEPLDINKLPVEKLAEKFVKINFCNGIKASGNACNNKALYQGFCGVHKTQGVKKTVSLCIAVCKNGNACKYKAKFGNKCGIHKSL